MSRDIVTRADAAHANIALSQPEEGGVLDQDLGGAERIDGVEPDSWYKRLMKYIPGEAIGLYLALDRLAATQDAAQGHSSLTNLSSVTTSPTGNPSHWLWYAATLAIAAIFNILYLRKVWRVRRSTQIAVSTVALLAYVYATGGMFAALGLTAPLAQAFVLIVTAAFLGLFEPPGSADVAVTLAHALT